MSSYLSIYICHQTLDTVSFILGETVFVRMYLNIHVTIPSYGDLYFRLDCVRTCVYVYLNIHITMP